MLTWDFDDTYTEDADKDSGTDNDDAFIDVNFGQGDLKETDLLMIVDRAEDKQT
jgi:hypothetical protein